MSDPWDYPVPPSPPIHHTYERNFDRSYPQSYHNPHFKRQDYISYGHQPQSPYESEDRSMQTSSKLPAKPEYHIFVDSDGQDYQFYPSSEPEEYHMSGQDYQIYSSSDDEDCWAKYVDQPRRRHTQQPPPAPTYEDDHTPFIPPPLHLRPAMYWTVVSPILKQQGKHLEGLSRLTPEAIPPSFQLPPLSDLEPSEYHEHELERDGFEVTGSIVCEGTLRNELESAAGVGKGRNDLMDDVIENGPVYTARRQIESKTPKSISINKDDRKPIIMQKEQISSSPTIAISPNKFWESLMKKNEKVQQEQQQTQSIQTGIVAPLAPSSKPQDVALAMNIKPEIGSRIVRKTPIKRKIHPGRSQKKKSVESSKTQSNPSRSSVKRRTARKATPAAPAKRESRSDRYKRMRGELVIGKGMEATSCSASSSSSEHGEEESHENIMKRRHRPPGSKASNRSRSLSRLHLSSLDATHEAGPRHQGRPPKLKIIPPGSDFQTRDDILIDSPSQEDTPSPRLSPHTEQTFKLATAAYQVSNERKDSKWISLTDLLGITKSDEEAWNKEMHDESMDLCKYMEI